MPELLLGLALVLLLTLAASLVRVLRGPTRADRMMGAQLIGTCGVGILLLLAAASGRWAIVDVALVLALLAAFASVAFVKAASPEGDPEAPP
jgi:multicomponent Na+:H+ antiporter subunit F